MITFQFSLSDQIKKILQADVVCKQLGFNGALTVHSESYFGMVSNDFSYDDISCDGGEGALDDCVHANVENCGPNEGAGVECYSGEVTSTTEKYPGGEFFHIFAVSESMDNLTHFFSAWQYVRSSFVKQICKQDCQKDFSLFCAWSDVILEKISFGFMPEDESPIDCCRKFWLQLLLKIKLFIVELVGGSDSTEGNVFTTNPRTGVKGPICDDHWTLTEVGN